MVSEGLETKGLSVSDKAKDTRTFTVVVSGDEEALDTFAVVMGSIMENFRGISIEEFSSDEIVEGDALAELNYAIACIKKLTPEQQAQLDEFTAALNTWEGEPS